jgi:hypothetical protein
MTIVVKNQMYAGPLQFFFQKKDFEPLREVLFWSDGDRT